MVTTGRNPAAGSPALSTGTPVPSKRRRAIGGARQGVTNEMLHNEAVKPLETELKQLQRECAGLEHSSDDDDTRMHLASIQESILLKRFEISWTRLTTGKGNSRSAANLSKAAAMLIELCEELASCDDKQYEQFLSAKKEDLAQKQAATSKNSAAASKRAADPSNGFGKGAGGTVEGGKQRAADPTTGFGKGTKLDTFADTNGLPWASSDDPPNGDGYHFVVLKKGPSDRYDKLWCVTCKKWIPSNERSAHQLRHPLHGRKAVAARKAAEGTNKISSFFKKAL
jgi:hypothetical protein